MDVLITGAAGGLGAATTERLVRAGLRVVATDVSDAVLDRWQDDRSVTPLVMDVTNVDSVASVAATLGERLDGLDGLVNNAGLAHVGSVVESSVEEYDRVMSVNVRGGYLVTHHLFPLLHARRGRVVNITSEVARAPQGFGFYSVSKVAFEAWSDALRQELQLEGMHVSSIRPGAHRTAILDASRDGFRTAEERNPILGRHIARSIAVAEKQLSKGNDPSDVADAVLAALTDERPKRRYHVNTSPMLTAVGSLPGGLRDRLLKVAFSR